MIYIEKLPEPQELLQCKREGLERYTDLQALTRKAIIKQLYREQKGLCAYCMRRLNEENMQIEHYIPQHDEEGNYLSELSIDYHNMLGVCPGGKGTAGYKRNDLTCDQHRGNVLMTVDPLKRDSVEKIKYSSNGTIYSDDPDINKDLDQVLNLNCTAARLKENRKAALDSFRASLHRKYGTATISTREWEKLRSHYYNGKNDSRVEYAGMFIYFIEKKLRAANRLSI